MSTPCTPGSFASAAHKSSIAEGRLAGTDVTLLVSSGNKPSRFSNRGSLSICCACNAVSSKTRQERGTIYERKTAQSARQTFNERLICSFSLSTFMTLHWTRLPGCTTSSGVITLSHDSSEMWIKPCTAGRLGAVLIETYTSPAYLRYLKHNTVADPALPRHRADFHRANEERQRRHSLLYA